MGRNVVEADDVPEISAGHSNDDPQLRCRSNPGFLISTTCYEVITRSLQLREDKSYVSCGPQVMILEGGGITVELSGTSVITTALGPILTLLPMRILPRTMAPAPT